MGTYQGHVSRRKVGKAYFYRAVTHQQEAVRSTLREMVEAYFNGSTKNLVLNLIRHEKLSEKELLELKRLADGGKPSALTTPSFGKGQSTRALTTPSFGKRQSTRPQGKQK